MTVGEVRKRYLDFFAKRGHAIIPSAPIVPENDPTTLFTSSGMQPLVPYLLGQEHPKGTRLADSQISFRAGDIEEVGDNRHTTFFEMLGNWSLGDYFKKEQLPWFFEYLTSAEEGLNLDPKNLYVTVFAGDAETGMAADTEAVKIWQNLFESKNIDAKFVELGTEEAGYEKGMQGGRVFSYGAKKNWWSRAGVPANMPPGEPGGPDSEVFYDFGLPHDTKWGAHCHPNCDCGRFIEIGNSVFMQFIKNADGTFSDLPKQNVDFGGGLERLTAATLSNPDVFLIDVFDKVRSNLEKISDKAYTSNAETTRAFRVILDHMRAATFILASGVRPSNTEQGYVLRRLLRRSMLFIRKLNPQASDTTFTSLGWIAEMYIEAYQDQYSHLASMQKEIQNWIVDEENRFNSTLVQGMKEFEKLKGGERITGEEAFTLFSTYGFPFELTAEYAKELGIEIDTEGFNAAKSVHQATSRAGAAQKFAGGLADHSEQTIRYHTTHHILLKALQQVLGKDVHQRGSNITSERLRIDFSYGAKMTPEQIKQVEAIVNEQIKKSLPVERITMPKEEAEELGAEHEFGAKYPDTVSVYMVGPSGTSNKEKAATAFSIEFCGGPHVSNTNELIGTFKILKEEASSAGVRRIKAVLE